MKTRMARFFTILTVVLFVSLLSGEKTIAQSPADSHGTMYLANHHKELKFSLAPTESRTFSLPKNDFPVRIEASTSNVPIVVMGTTTDLGPLILGVAVAAFDSAAGIANIYGNTSCPGQDSCQAFACYAPPQPNVLGIELCLVLTLDRHTGNLTISLRNPQNAAIGTDRISYSVSMWF